MRIPTEIGDSSRYTLPLPAFWLRTDDFSSMHTTPRKTCPRHQEICCKNPFPEMQSFLGFGTRRLLNVGCFIDISGAKTIQKHRSSRQIHSKRNSDKARHLETPSFKPHLLELTHFYQVSSEKHLEAILFGLHSLELTLFKHTS